MGRWRGVFKSFISTDSIQAGRECVCVCVCIIWSGWGDVGLCSGFGTKGRVILRVGGLIGVNTKHQTASGPEAKLTVRRFISTGLTPHNQSADMSLVN